MKKLITLLVALSLTVVAQAATQVYTCNEMKETLTTPPTFTTVLSTITVRNQDTATVKIGNASTFIYKISTRYPDGVNVYRDVTQHSQSLVTLPDTSIIVLEDTVLLNCFVK